MAITAWRTRVFGRWMSRNSVGSESARDEAADWFDPSRVIRHPLAGRILRFGLIGVAVNAVYAGLFFLLTTTHTGGRFLAGMVSYAVACAVQYSANALLTFQRSILKLGQIVRYLTVVAFGCAASSAFLAYASPSLRLPDVVALLVVMFSMPIINFVFFLKFVYK